MSNRSQPPENDERKYKGKFSGWCKILLVSSRAIALSLDPLFFFVPVIHEDKKCISEDKIMWINAVFWRSFLDLIYLVYFVVEFSNTSNQEGKEKNEVGSVPNVLVVHHKLECGHVSVFQCVQCAKGQIDKKEEEKREKCPRNLCIWMRFVINILVILPIPQVVMPIILSDMRHTDSATILNAVILFQYGPRVLQIYLSLKELDEFDVSVRIKALFNFFLYLLAGHVFGAFWYFFSTQRLTSCWRKACLHQGGCVQGFFNCEYSSRNLSVLHDFCSIDSTNTSTFDFGIFLEARKSGILGTTDFLKKLIYSAWWGLRNLSSFGSNLQTSTYIWENAFALGVSIFGLLLFLYFMGNLQVYMQRSATKSIEKSEKDKYPALDEAVVESILNELGQLYKKRFLQNQLKNDPERDGAVDVEHKTASILQRVCCCNHPKRVGA